LFYKSETLELAHSRLIFNCGKYFFIIFNVFWPI